MKLAIISDLHLGYAYNTERKEDSFVQAEEAFEKALENKVDLILLAGDIFDSRVPTQDILARAMGIFLKPLASKGTGLELKYGIGKDEKEIPKLATGGVPVIAIHGTHERRGKDFTNPVQVLEKAGLLIHLHCNSLVFEKSGKKLVVHGMSGVPERYAKIVLDKWSPKLVPKAFNILLLHQSIGQYLYSREDTPTLNLEDLPENFDLIVNGHIHWPDTKEIGKTKFLLPGSTIITQMRKNEAEKQKGFFIFDTEHGLKFENLEKTRPFFYKEIEFEKSTPEQVLKKIENELEKIQFKGKKPMVRIRLKGSLDKGFEKEDLELARVEAKFRDKFILSIDKGKLSTRELLERREILEQLREKQLSVDELGMEILKKHLNELKYTQIFDSDKLLNILTTEDTDSVYEKLRNMRKNG